MQSACESGVCATILRCLEESSGGVNGVDPLGNTCERPIHVLFKHAHLIPASSLSPVLEAVFSLPALDLSCRILPHGSIAQYICSLFKLTPEAVRVSLVALAKVRQLPVTEILDEKALIGGHPTPSCLNIVMWSAIGSGNLKRFEELLALGAKPDERDTALLDATGESDDEVQKIRLRGSGAIRRRMKVLIDGGGSAEELQDARRPRRRNGPKQFFK
jgi:hypothetical protein